TPAFAGLVIGLWGAGGAVGTLIGGVLADRWGRKPTFLTGMYASAVMMIVVGLSRGAVEIALTVTLLGLLSECARPGLQAMTVDVAPPEKRLQAFSLTYWVVNLGYAVAAMTAGFVSNVDFLLLFVIDAVATVTAATLVLVKMSEPVRTRSVASVDG